MSKDSSNTPAESPHAKPSDGGIRWKVSTAVVVLVAGFLLAQVVGALLVTVYPHLHHWDTTQTTDWLNNSIVAQFLYVFLSEAVLVGGLYAFIRWRKGSLRALGVRRPDWLDAGWMGVGVLAYLGLYLAVISVVMSLVHLNVNQQQDLGFTNPVGGSALALTFVSLVVLPPLAEEFAFRGFLFGTLRRRLGFAAATLGTSALFAVPHLLEGNGGGLLWVAGLDTFVLSLVLCFVREKTGRLWAGMGVHMVKNSIAFMTLYLWHVH